MSLPKLYSGLLGAVYTLVGLLGFAVTGASLTPMPLVVFPVNLVHNLVHLVVGLAGLGAFASGWAGQRLYAQAIGVVFILLALVGVIDPFPALVPLGGPDIVLHLATGVLGLYIGFTSPRTQMATA
jgi:hypothetical protein